MKRRFGIERLESRNLLAVTIQIDYSFDSNNFFANADAKDAIEDVAAAISSRLDDTLDAIAPSGNNTWSQAFRHPGTGIYGNWLTDNTVPADTYVVYVGGRDFTGSTLGLGGPGGWSASGSGSWINAIDTRGETGVATNTDFANWGGVVTFDSSDTNWHYDETTTGLTSGEADFRSVAYHELIHALGMVYQVNSMTGAPANSWSQQVSGNTFAGPNSVAEYDGAGNVPLHGDLSHLANGITDGGQEAAMDPSITSGTRKFPTPLDYAILADIGWEVLPPATPGSVTVSGNDLIVNGDNNVNLIEIRNVPGVAGVIRVLVDSYDYGVYPIPVGDLVVNALGGDDEIRLQPTVDVTTRLYGGSGIDLIRGGQGVDTIYGGPGNDNLYGRDNDDVIFGDDGIDKLFGMNGDDELHGGNQNDNLTGGAGNDMLFGDGGNDTLLGSANNDTLRGGTGNDIVNGGSGNDTLYGDDGDDTILGLGGNEFIYGGPGDDDINGGAGSDQIYGDAGEDTIFGAGGNDTIYGGDDMDTIRGEAGIDSLFGQGGTDFLYGGTSADNLNGGAGNDVLFGDGGNDTLVGGDDDDEIHGGTGADFIKGDAGNDTLYGDGGADDMYGNDGNDTFTGGLAADLMDGGLGTDTAIDNGERGEISIEIS